MFSELGTQRTFAAAGLDRSKDVEWNVWWQSANEKEAGFGELEVTAVSMFPIWDGIKRWCSCKDASAVQESVSYSCSQFLGSSSLFPAIATLFSIITTPLISKICRISRWSPHSFKHKEANKAANYYHLGCAEKINGHSWVQDLKALMPLLRFASVWHG